jgi:hypothetical protein
MNEGGGKAHTSSRLTVISLISKKVIARILSVTFTMPTDNIVTAFSSSNVIPAFLAHQEIVIAASVNEVCPCPLWI